jgi:hypothetical protein
MLIDNLHVHLLIYGNEYNAVYSNVNDELTINDIEYLIIEDYLGGNHALELEYYVGNSITAITKTNSLAFYGLTPGGSITTPALFGIISLAPYPSPILFTKNIQLTFNLVSDMTITIPSKIFKVDVLVDSVTNTILVSSLLQIKDIRTHMNQYIPEKYHKFIMISYDNYFTMMTYTRYELYFRDIDNNLYLNDIFVSQAFDDHISTTTTTCGEYYDPVLDEYFTTCVEIIERNFYFYETFVLSFVFPEIRVKSTCDDITYDDVTTYTLTSCDVACKSISSFIKKAERENLCYKFVRYFKDDVIDDKYCVKLYEYPDANSLTEFVIIISKNPSVYRNN